MDKSLDDIIINLTRETLAWRTLQCTVTVRQQTYIATGKSPPSSSTQTSEYLAKAGGWRKYESAILREQGRNSLFLGYSDGRRCAAVDYRRSPEQMRQQQITISKTFMNEQMIGYVSQPEPLALQFVGLVPLREAITKAEKIGADSVIGRDCVIYYFHGVPGRRTSDLVYHLDVATSVPLKVEFFDDHDRYLAQSPSTVWEALTLDEVQGYHVALNSRHTSIKDSNTASPSRQLTNDYHFETIKFDEPIPDAAFWPKYDPGVFINDLIAKTSYYNTPDKKAPREESTQTEVAAGPPIVADEAADWAPWLSGVGVGLGAALLVGGIMLKLKGR